LISRYKIESSIELGGFPGYYTIYMRKYFKVRSALFDYFVHPEIVKSLMKANGLKKGDLEIIEGDLFAFPESENKFGMVMSCGLIEHFEDTSNIIEQHLKFLDTNGTLFITLPNFRGVNGWIQKTFDRDNYDKHNIKSMDPRWLRQILIQLNLEVIECRFYGHFGVWLENPEQKSTIAKWVKQLIWVTGKVLTKLISFDSKLLSPYILIIAKRQ
jgi:SAM-dependent methyltransferase